jgi:beta-glucanase (GH16 family)
MGTPRRQFSLARTGAIALAIGALIATATATVQATATPATPAAPAAPAANTSAAVNAPAMPCGGLVIAKTAGGYWTCSFDDNFNGRSLDATKWTVQQTANSGYHSGAECFVDRSANTSVANGVLSLTVRKESAPFTCTDPLGDYRTQYTSGMVSTWGKFTQAYGRFEVRAKLPAAKIRGLQESFWLWPADATKYGPSWPMSGEIDIAEVYSQYPDRAVPYIHYVPASLDASVTNNYCLISDITKFHSYVAEWTPSEITVIYDGHTCMVHRWNPALPLVGSQPFDQPFMVVLTQALGITTNEFDPATTPLPATTQVDYVRVWK